MSEEIHKRNFHAHGSDFTAQCLCIFRSPKRFERKEHGGRWGMSEATTGASPRNPQLPHSSAVNLRKPLQTPHSFIAGPLRISLYNRTLYSLVIPRYQFSESCYFKIEAYFKPFNFYDTAGYSLHTKPTDTIILWHRSVLICSGRRLSYVQSCTFAGEEECAEANSLSGLEKIGELAVTLRGIVSAVLRAAQMEPLPTAFSKVG